MQKFFISLRLFRLYIYVLIFTLCFLLNGCKGTISYQKSHNNNFSIEKEKSNIPFLGNRSDLADSNEKDVNVVGYDNYFDPLIHINRVIFGFNHISYRYLLIPLSKVYQKILPNPVKKRISLFFNNLQNPIYAVNHLLQFQFPLFGRDLLRFSINSTLGLLGFFDPASIYFNLNASETHLEDTFANYGLGYGMYLVLPLLGPSDLRNGVSNLGEYFLHPVNWLAEEPQSTIVRTFDSFQEFTPRAEKYPTLYNKSDDPYIFFRNMYLQGVQRDADY